MERVQAEGAGAARDAVQPGKDLRAGARLRRNESQGCLLAGGPRAAGLARDATSQLLVASALVASRFEAQGFAAAWSTPAAYAGFLQAEVDKWGKVVKASGAKID